MDNMEIYVDEKNSKKSVNLSSRIDKNLYDLLVEDAKIKGVSVNSLMNSMIRKHVAWERFSDELGLASISKRSLERIFENLSDNIIEQIANEIGGIIQKEMVFLKHDQMNFDNIMDVIETNGTRFGFVKHIVENSTHTINIHHGINKNFSRFLAGTHMALAEDLSIKLTIDHLDERMIRLKIKNPE